MCAKSLAMYDAFVERVRADGGSAFEYARPGTLETAFTEEQASELKRTAGALRAQGVRAEWLDGSAARSLEPAISERVIGALRIDDHGFVEMPGFVDALSVAARMRGASFHSPIDVTKIEPAPAGQVRVHTATGTHIFDRVVAAGGSWSNRLRTGAPGVKPVKGQLVRLRFDAPPSTRVLWSASCYLVPWQDGTLLAGATMEEAGFDERTTADGVRGLVKAAAELLPAAAGAGFVDVRAGLRPAHEGDDPRPFIGPSPSIPSVIVAAGHFRNGVLLAPLTASLVSDQVLGEHDGKTE